MFLLPVGMFLLPEGMCCHLKECSYYLKECFCYQKECSCYLKEWIFGLTVLPEEGDPIRVEPGQRFQHRLQLALERKEGVAASLHKDTAQRKRDKEKTDA